MAFSLLHFSYLLKSTNDLIAKTDANIFSVLIFLYLSIIAARNYQALFLRTILLFRLTSFLSYKFFFSPSHHSYSCCKLLNVGTTRFNSLSILFVFSLDILFISTGRIITSMTVILQIHRAYYITLDR